MNVVNSTADITLHCKELFILSASYKDNGATASIDVEQVIFIYILVF